MNFKIDSKTIVPIIIVAGGAAGEWLRRHLRENGHKKLVKEVKKSLPVYTAGEDDSDLKNRVLISIVEEEYDISNCIEIQISESEVDDWKAFFSMYGGKTVESILTSSTTSGLLKCDVPLKDLFRIKNKPEMMRGWVMRDGKFSKQAAFSEVGVSKIAPLLAFQCMAAVTSQYYQQILIDKLENIETKLDNILSILRNEDRAKLSVAFGNLREISQKHDFDMADKIEVTNFAEQTAVIREKYQTLLNGINLNPVAKWSDKKEAEGMIDNLEKSNYFHYLEMAMQAECLYFMANVILMQITKCNKDDQKRYSGRINLDFWNTYSPQFKKIRHEVIRYLELEAKASLVQGESIMLMKKNQQNLFDKFEKDMLNLESQFNIDTQIFIQVQESGELKQYLNLNDNIHIE